MPKYNPERIAQLKQEIAAREIALGRRDTSTDKMQAQDKAKILNERPWPASNHLYRNGGFF